MNADYIKFCVDDRGIHITIPLQDFDRWRAMQTPVEIFPWNVVKDNINTTRHWLMNSRQIKFVDSIYKYYASQIYRQKEKIVPNVIKAYIDEKVVRMFGAKLHLNTAYEDFRMWSVEDGLRKEDFLDEMIRFLGSCDESFEWDHYTIRK